MTDPAITIAIVNHQTRDDLAASLRSVGLEHPVVVIDNASTDGSAAMVRTHFPHVRLHASPDNLGYGAAANQAMALATTPYLLLLNADVRIQPAAVDTLAAHLDQHPDVAVVGPRIEDEHGVVQHTGYDDPTPSRILVDSAGLLEVGRRLRPAAAGTEPPHPTPDWVLGAAMALRRHAFEQVGGFDPGFFLYFEEIDLCRRLREHGWLIGYENSATATHAGGASTQHTPVASERRYYRSGARWFSHRGARRRYRWAVTAAMATRWATSPLAPDPADRRAAARSVLADARRNWPAPDTTSQQPPSTRADWRALIPWPNAEPRLHLHSPAHQWLADDGWWVPDGEPASATVELGAVPQPDVPTTDIVAWRRRAPVGLRNHRRKRLDLRTRGYEHTRSYWAIPDLDRCRRLIPLDADGPLRWWGHTLAPDRALAKTLSRWPALTRRLLRTLGPDVLFVASRQPQAAEHRLVLTSGYDNASRTVVATFRPGSDHPAMIEKWATRPTANPAARREHEALVALHGSLPPSLTQALSEPVSQQTIGGVVVTRERPVDGPSLAARIGGAAGADPSRLEQARFLLSEARDWLVELHHATAVDEPWSRDRFIGDLVTDLGRHRPLSPAIRSLIDQVDAVTAQLAPPSIPVVQRHFDFGPWNLLYGDRLGVIDWESTPPRPADGRGLAGADLMYLVKYWLHLTMAEGPDRAELDGFHFLARRGDLDDPRETARDVLAGFADAVGLAPALMPLVYVHTWLEQARFGLTRPGAALEKGPLAYLDTTARHGDRLVKCWGERSDSNDVPV